MLRSVLKRPSTGGLAAACAAVAIGAAGCGSSAGSGGAEPASLLPANVSVYAQGVLQPEGQQRAQLDAQLRRILHTRNVAGTLTGLIDRAGRKDHLTYAQDIRPWLGRYVGFFVDASHRDRKGNPFVAVLVSTTDPGKAQQAIDKAPDPGDRKVTYRDVTYNLQRDGAAAGVVRGFVVSGDEGALRQVVDSAEGSGPRLADSEQFKRARAEAGDQGVVDLYVNPGALVGQLQARGGLGPGGAVLSQLAGQLPKEAGAVVRATAGGFEVQSAAVGGANPPVPGGLGDGAGALRGAPADSWLAFGIGNLGGHGQAALAQLRRLGGFGGVGLQQTLDQLRQGTGLDVQRDVLAWMGDAVLFVRGTSRADVGGALAVRSKDPARMRATVDRIARLAQRSRRGGGVSGVRGVDAGFAVRRPGQPEVDVVAKGDRFVVAVSRQALAAALRPGRPLGATPGFASATRSLGGLQPMVFFDLPPVLRLAESTGATSDPSYRRARAYLQAFTTLVSGGRREGAVSRARAEVGVR